MRALSCLGLLVVAACGGSATGPGERPPAEVGVVTVRAEFVSDVAQLGGRVTASRVAQVRARATGIVLERIFVEGADVDEDEVLFRIDPAPQRAAAQAARAQLAMAQAELTSAQQRADRYAPLAQAHAVSALDNDDATARLAAATASRDLASAALATARLNLDYTTVTAPIRGRIGRSLVTEGALVSAAEGTHLATIMQLDPVYVDLVQSGRQALELRHRLASGQASAPEQAMVRIVDEAGFEHGYPGTLLFSDVQIDPVTGSASLRISVPNPDHTLLPGAWVTARVEQVAAVSALTVPQQAVQRDHSGPYVIVVGDDAVAMRRDVTLGISTADSWVVTQGVVAGDVVVADGLQGVRLGQPVRTVAFEPVQRGAN